MANNTLKVSQKTLLAWMKIWANDFRDPVTGEINCTLMAESAAAQYNLYEGKGYDIPEIVFELALQANKELDGE